MSQLFFLDREVAVVRLPHLSGEMFGYCRKAEPGALPVIGIAL